MRSLRLPSRCRRGSCRWPGRGFRAPALMSSFEAEHHRNFTDTSPIWANFQETFLICQCARGPGPPFVVDRNICHFLWYGGLAGEGLRSDGVDDLPLSKSGCSILPLARRLLGRASYGVPRPLCLAPASSGHILEKQPRL